MVMTDNIKLTQAEIEKLSKDAASRQLTKDEVMALHEAARDNINSVEQKALEKFAYEVLKKENPDENRISKEAINIKIEEIKKSNDYPAEILIEADVWSHMKARPYLDHIEYHMVEHCNLNCAACGHFSNIAEKNFADLDKFRSDYGQFVKIMGDKLKGIILMGGEPLLHPSIELYIKASRELSPNGNIDMFTNGLLLKKMPESFWKTCSECNARLIISVYPVNLDVEEIKRLAKNYNVQISIADRLGENWVFWTMDLEGKQNKTKSFILCSQANSCNQLKNGKVYPCSTAAYIEHFNKAFGVSLELDEKDSLDIFRNGVTSQDVLDFLSRPVPFCRYCSRDKFRMTPWQASKRVIEEWLDVK